MTDDDGIERLRFKDAEPTGRRVRPLPEECSLEANAEAATHVHRVLAADETRAHRPDVDARLIWGVEAAAGASGARPVTQPDHPDSLLARYANLAAPGPQRTGRHLATDVGINTTSA